MFNWYFCFLLTFQLFISEPILFQNKKCRIIPTFEAYGGKKEILTQKQSGKKLRKFFHGELVIYEQN